MASPLQLAWSVEQPSMAKNQVSPNQALLNMGIEVIQGIYIQGAVGTKWDNLINGLKIKVVNTSIRTIWSKKPKTEYPPLLARMCNFAKYVR